MQSPNTDIHQRGILRTAETKPVVFVVDDDISVRESLESLIGSAGWSLETFASGEEFLRRPPSGCPSCLLLDYSLPNLNGLEIQQRIAADRPGISIIFLTGHGDVRMTVKAMKAGAVEFLTKPFRSDVLLTAIQDAIERSTAALQRETRIGAIRSRHALLTLREREVMALVVRGLLNKQVASELTISEITVKAHRGRVMRKMQARSLADLVRMNADLQDTTAPSAGEDRADVVNDQTLSVGGRIRCAFADRLQDPCR